MKWLLLLTMTLFGAMGGLFLKKVSGAYGFRRKFLLFFMGCAMYAIGAVLNVLALRYMPYTIVFPFTSFTYVWTFVLSLFVLGETLNRYKISGLCLILVGAYIIVH